MPRESQSFGQQAAQFSLYAPVAVFVIGVCTIGNRDQRGVGVSIAVLNSLLVVTGLVLGITALASMRRYGRRGILVRAIVGVLLNGLCVLGLAVVFSPFGGISRQHRLLVGHWRGPVDGPPARQVDLTLTAAGTFAFAATPDPARPPTSFSGTWVLTPGRIVGITIDHVDAGDPAAVGKRIGLGHVQAVNDDELVLSTDHGDERYRRQ